MDAYDIDPHLLQAIVLQQIVTPQIAKQLAEWNHNLAPSLNYAKSILSGYLTSEGRKYMKIVMQQIGSIIVKLQDNKCPKIFMRAMFAVLKDNYEHLKGIVTTEELIKLWKVVSVDLLEIYMETFRLAFQGCDKNSKSEGLVLIEQVQRKIDELIESKDYEGAMTLIKLVNYPHTYLQKLFLKMNTSKQASKAAALMKSHKIDSSLFPAVGQRLNKNMIRHFLKSKGWEGAQEIFSDQPQALACLVEDLVYKGKEKEAVSVWWRHPELARELQKKEAIQLIAAMQLRPKQQVKTQIINNSYDLDYFGPTDADKYLTLSQLGIQRKDVFWIDQSSENKAQFAKALINADMIAIDTESIVGKTKLEKQTLEPASIIQIALKERVYILDGQKCKDKIIRNAIQIYFTSGKPILGHAIDNDLDGVLASIGLNKQQIQQLKILNIIDTAKLFKSIYPNQKYSNLAHISKTVLGRQVCKHQTLTNWSHRPLRQNQLHYASMDAMVVISIYLKLLHEVGQNMIAYFLSE